MLKQNLVVSLQRNIPCSRLSVVQGDTGRKLSCVIVDFDILENYTANISAIKPSGGVVYNDTTIRGNVVEVELTRQMLAEKGEVKCQLQFISNSDVVTSFPFSLKVAENSVNADTLESSDEFKAFENGLQKLGTINYTMSGIESELALFRSEFESIMGEEIPTAYIESAIDDYIAENESDIVTTTKLTDYIMKRPERVSKTGTSILIDRQARDIRVENATQILYSNRFNLAEAEFDFNGWSTTIEKENGGITLEREVIGTGAHSYAYNYTAEYTGDICFSCDAYADYIEDLMVLIKLNDVEVEKIYGISTYKCKFAVEEDDIITIRFYSRINNETKPNVLKYHHIMLQYGDYTEWKPYVGVKKKYKKLVLDGSAAGKGAYDDWETALNSTDTTYYVKFSGALTNVDSSCLPSENGELAKIVVVGADLVSYNATYNCTDGIGVSTGGIVALYFNNGAGRADVVEYLTDNPITIYYTSSVASENVHYAEGVPSDDTDRNITTSCIIKGNKARVSYTYDASGKKYTHVAMGDSITGMFGNDTSYPDIINRLSSNINSINVGFSGSTMQDHSTTQYIPFSFHRLVDSMTSGTWTTQTNALEDIDNKWYPEHLAALRTIDFTKVDYLTIFYGANDWLSSMNLAHESENDDRTNNLEDALRYGIDKLLTHFPKLKIIVLSPYMLADEVDDGEIAPNSAGIYMRDISDKIEEIGKDFSLPTINLYYAGVNKYNNSQYTSDGTHPNTTLREIIAKNIIEVINKH